MSNDSPVPPAPSSPWRFAVPAALGVCLLWAYWPTLREVARAWSDNPQYSHGYLVPLFAVYLLWSKRERLRQLDARASWWAVPFLAFGAAMRLAGAYLSVEWLDAASLVPTLLGVVCVLGGVPALKLAAAPVLFLVFMVPLPFRFEVALGQQLQAVATVMSTYALQTLGFPAVSEGNIILIDQARVGVAEACSGLSMLMTFVAMSVGVVLVVDRPLLDRALILLSAVPIAVVANVARITLTGVLYETVTGGVANAVYHDLAGWLMMPLALLLLWVELKLIDWVLVPQAEPAPVRLDLPAGLPAGPAALPPAPAKPAGKSKKAGKKAKAV